MLLHKDVKIFTLFLYVLSFDFLLSSEPPSEGGASFTHSTCSQTANPSDCPVGCGISFKAEQGGAESGNITCMINCADMCAYGLNGAPDCQRSAYAYNLKAVRAGDQKNVTEDLLKKCCAAAVKCLYYLENNNVTGGEMLVFLQFLSKRRAGTELDEKLKCLNIEKLESKYSKLLDDMEQLARGKIEQQTKDKIDRLKIRMDKNNKVLYFMSNGFIGVVVITVLYFGLECLLKTTAIPQS